jgi:hypothetical protein
MGDERAERRRAWVEAANRFIEDLEADVVCPENADAKLTAQFIQTKPGDPGGELVITCPVCGARTFVRLAKGPAVGGRPPSTDGLTAMDRSDDLN